MQAKHTKFLQHYSKSLAIKDLGWSNALVIDLAKAVKDARLAKGLSQPALGRMLGIDGQTISNLETGRTQSLSLSKMPELARALELPLSEVMEVAKQAHAARAASGRGEEEIDHAFWGSKLYEVRHRLMMLIEPLQRQIGKSSKEMRRLQRAITSVDDLRNFMEQRYERQATDRDWNMHTYRPGSTWRGIPEGPAEVLASELEVEVRPLVDVLVDFVRTSPMETKDRLIALAREQSATLRQSGSTKR